ncbi:frataxin domain-containing protein [Anaplasma phagocytophilum]|uniref:frataxin domain-containing protein n=1 Tax=Anaplasma phagocytophilum TaxID=948 RepID=UPI000533A08C|nr:frataxin domain-containing protein [Anaplasma phagocytophilum]
MPRSLGCFASSSKDFAIRALLMVDKGSGVSHLDLARGALDSLVSMVEEISSSAGSLLSCDSNGDVVEISDGDSDYLISWHAQTQQIWVASPVSGSVRFVYDADQGLWCDQRSGRELFAFVRQEICEIFS